MNTTGQRLKHIINLLNLTQSEVADRFGINRSLLSQIYNDKQQISKLFMYALKAEFNINPAWLLTGEGEMFITPSDVKDGKVSYTAISDINEITRTRWFKNLTKEQREIITNCSAVKDKEILKKVSGIISRQAAKEEGDRELEELEDKIK
jgi:transcriptional regulator with XRE-family HTH domain